MWLLVNELSIPLSYTFGKLSSRHQLPLERCWRALILIWCCSLLLLDLAWWFYPILLSWKFLKIPVVLCNWQTCARFTREMSSGLKFPSPSLLQMFSSNWSDLRRGRLDVQSEPPKIHLYHLKTSAYPRSSCLTTLVNAKTIGRTTTIVRLGLLEPQIPSNFWSQSGKLIRHAFHILVTWMQVSWEREMHCVNRHTLFH